MNEETLRAILDILNDAEYRDGKTEFLEEIRKKAKELAPHFDEDYPEELLRANHPSEEAWMVEYRKKRWTAVSTMTTGRVKTALGKIQQSDDFKILLEDDEVKTRLIRENSFKAYITENLPKFKSLESWSFQVFLDTYLKDANAVVAVLPDIEEFVKTGDPNTIQWQFPYPQIFESEDIHFESEKGVIVRVKDHKDEKGKKWDQFLSISQEGLVLVRQFQNYKKNENAFITFPAPFDFYEYPVYKVGTIVCELEDNQPVYDSVMQPCVPALNEMVYRHADLIVNWGMHGNPQKWEIVGRVCKTCNGRGSILNRTTKVYDTCGDCNGTGTSSEGSPFGKIEINIQQPNNVNPDGTGSSTAIPTPPAGYVARDIEALKAQQEDIKYQSWKALSAIGLELLAQVPASQSGIAKEYDRKEVKTFFYTVAVAIETMYMQVAKCLFYTRYTALGVLPALSEENIQAAMPKMVIPTDYDILTADLIAAQLERARKANFSPVVVSGLEYDYTQKLYGENSKQLKILKLLKQLDPLPYQTGEEKALLVESGGCTQLDFILSNYLAGFVGELLYTEDDWMDKPLKDQKAQLYQLAREKQAEIRAGLVPIVEVGA